MIRACQHCQKAFETEVIKKVSCSRRCSQAWRRLHVYGDKYTIKFRGANPRNFLQSLSKKLKERRSLDLVFLTDLYTKQEGKCALSGRDMTYITGQGRVPTNISIDRVDSSLGYTEDNIQLVCIQANKMKAELSNQDLLQWCQDVVHHGSKI